MRSRSVFASSVQDKGCQCLKGTLRVVGVDAVLCPPILFRVCCHVLMVMEILICMGCMERCKGPSSCLRRGVLSLFDAPRKQNLYVWRGSC
jgi:hypothetical protein